MIVPIYRVAHDISFPVFDIAARPPPGPASISRHQPTPKRWSIIVFRVRNDHDPALPSRTLSCRWITF